jgi:protein-S-isoprenylcysteine O-methyltransferase Ste14
MHQFITFKPPRIALGFVVLAIAVNAFVPLAPHPSLPLAATITALLGFTLMIRAWWLFRQANTAICPTQSATTLVTHDVFSITRNPMYLGIILMLAGLAMATGSIAFYVAAFAYSVVIERVFCPYEERKSDLEFGDQYRAYTQRTRRWI